MTFSMQFLTHCNYQRLLPSAVASFVLGVMMILRLCRWHYFLCLSHHRGCGRQGRHTNITWFKMIFTRSLCPHASKSCRRTLLTSVYCKRGPLAERTLQNMFPTIESEERNCTELLTM